MGSGSSSFAASGEKPPNAVTPNPRPEDRDELPNMSKVKGSLLMGMLL
jgi:hypothetical protein